MEVLHNQLDFLRVMPSNFPKCNPLKGSGFYLAVLKSSTSNMMKICDCSYREKTHTQKKNLPHFMADVTTSLTRHEVVFSRQLKKYIFFHKS